MRVASGDCHVVIFARFRIDNLPVYLGYSGTSNGSRVKLQLLKSYKDVNGHEESVRWLALRNVQISECQNIFRFRH